MSRPYDARAIRSREALRAALLALIAERPFDQITIREITAEAGVSYPVFFRRYATKDQLLEDVATEEVRRLLALSMPIFDADKKSESVWELCRHIDDHRLLWTRLLTGGAAPMMREEFKRIAKEIGASMQENPWLPLELGAAFAASGLFEILAWWLSQPADYPMEKIVKIIDLLLVRMASPLDN